MTRKIDNVKMSFLSLPCMAWSCTLYSMCVLILCGMFYYYLSIGVALLHAVGERVGSPHFSWSPKKNHQVMSLRSNCKRLESVV